MNPLPQLDRLNLDSAAKSQILALFQTLLDQAAHDAKTIQAKDLKIQALTHELAHTFEPFKQGIGHCKLTLSANHS